MKNTDKTEPNHILIGIGGTGGKVLKAFPIVGLQVVLYFGQRVSERSP